MSEKKYEYRILPRRSLADIERRVRLMQKEKWQLVPGDDDPTICQALDQLARDEMVAVSMKRELPPVRLVAENEPRTRPLQGGYMEKDTLTGEMREPVIQRRDDYQK